MKLTNIANLYEEMNINGLNRQRFNFIYNGVESDAFFFIDTVPYLLMFGVKNKNIYFEIAVDHDLYVSNNLDRETYFTICKAFEIKYSEDHKFRPIDFFTAFNQKIPQHIKDTRKARPSDIIYYKRNVEEADKKYFWRFRNNGTNEHVSDDNLRKTLELMGIDAFERCRSKNVSTQWTDDPQKDNFDNWRIE